MVVAGHDAAEHRARGAEDDGRQAAEVLLRLLGDVEAVVEALDRAVLARLRDRLRQPGREIVDLRHERQHQGGEHGEEADREPEEDDGGGRPPPETRLEPLDQGIERDGQEGRGQDPHQHVPHPAREVADERQEEQADHELCDRRPADVDRQPAADDVVVRRPPRRLRDGLRFGDVRREAAHRCVRSSGILRCRLGSPSACSGLSLLTAAAVPARWATETSQTACTALGQAAMPSERRRFSSRSVRSCTNGSTRSGSNCVPAQRRSSAMASSWLLAALYGRDVTIAW